MQIVAVDEHDDKILKMLRTVNKYLLGLLEYYLRTLGEKKAKKFFKL